MTNLRDEQEKYRDDAAAVFIEKERDGLGDFRSLIMADRGVERSYKLGFDAFEQSPVFLKMKETLRFYTEDHFDDGSEWTKFPHGKFIGPMGETARKLLKELEGEK
jgi:hypothetical protein